MAIVYLFLGTKYCSVFKDSYISVIVAGKTAFLNTTSCHDTRMFEPTSKLSASFILHLGKTIVKKSLSEEEVLPQRRCIIYNLRCQVPSGT